MTIRVLANTNPMAAGAGRLRDGHPGNTATARPPGHLPTIIAIKAGF